MGSIAANPLAYTHYTSSGTFASVADLLPVMPCARSLTSADKERHSVGGLSRVRQDAAA